MSDLQQTTVRIPPKSIHKLKSLEIFKLYAWLQSNVPTLPAGFNREQTAALATGELGFLVKDSNVLDALRQLELTLPEAPKAADVRMYEKVDLLLEIAHFLLLTRGGDMPQAIRERSDGFCRKLKEAGV